MKKTLVCSILAFGIGFAVHAFIFPDVLTQQQGSLQHVLSITTQATPEPDSQTTIITFDGKKFNTHRVFIGFTRYVRIINTSKENLMWLISDNPSFATTRGYAYQEVVQEQMNKKGISVVRNKNNPQEQVKIIVK